MVADCIPVLFYDKQAQVIAVAHAGREGVKRGIVNQVVKRLRDEFKAQNLEIILGPTLLKVVVMK